MAADAMSAPVIAIEDVSKTYRMGEDVDVHALRHVSLAIRHGEFVAIMGASGSGKSTLMNILGCLDRPTSGRLLLEGTDVAVLAEPALASIRGRRIGFVFQNFNLLARTSAEDNVALPLFYAGRSKRVVERVRSQMAALGLSGRERNHPNQLSGGQQQRVAIARALINRPAILLADEPTGNLDSTTATDIMEAIRDLNHRRGVTVVLVTHEPEMAAYADRVITLRDGVVLSDLPSPDRMATPGVAAPEDEPEVAAENLEQVRSVQWIALVAALRALGQHKLRSALTMLGIFIGVAALIAMIAVGEGARAAVHDRLQSLGTDLLIALPASSHTGGVRGGMGSASSLKVSDAAAILEEDDAVSGVAYVNRQNAQVMFGDENWNTSIQGVTPSYLAIRDWTVAQGRAFRDDDERRGDTVCILGQTVVDALFPADAHPLGATVIVKSVPMQVVGILAAKGHSGGGQDQDDVVLVPFSTSQQRILGVAAPTAAPSQSARSSTQVTLPSGPTPSNPFGIQPRLAGFVHAIYIQAKSHDLVKEAFDQVTATLERHHRLKAGTDDDFSVRDLTEIAQVAEESSRVLEILLAVIASISLVVGGIGIMNILLVSVTERTREIGIRMAIGARRSHILQQFLLEAMALAAAGGGAGVLAGIAASEVISAVAGWPILLSPLVTVAAFLFSAAIGVFFGYYPARQASRLNPIEALRYE
jgi:macrolide transport system ATP-binding/permease protein